ncbi:MAG TPA: hypothetical protein VFC39_00755 [Acidobacteriaceae bacterium]|nr:hypothetical protein [Acidobacteriaceae bacterium]
MAFRECDALDALWVEHNPEGKSWQCRRAHRLFLGEFFSFYVCITERWILQHQMDRREDFFNAILDEVREKRLQDSWRPTMTPECRARSDSSLAARHDRKVSFMRNNYTHLRNGPGGVDIIAEIAALVLVKYFFAASGQTSELEGILSLLIKQLRNTSLELVATVPYAALRTGGGRRSD